ncbi:hypothetical protein FA15DRAFT_683610 [Coprinopsis marcescibilis]|uniref:Uncharacterized protein n=1 Tax=Coprinopsis marcescibilis TaxID=230819 RepID=A0A5C3KBI5_COPMA|nr:hypothetical protein FA15DRAFT_683610 [Coprinopsis marcescibilis]
MNLQVGRAKTDPLVHHGRHFGRTIQAFCRVQSLVQNGLTVTIQIELGRTSEDQLNIGERREYEIYKQLLGLSPMLEERLCTGSPQEIYYISEMITKGSSSARSDDTKSLKSVIVDWITPPNGILSPPLQRHVKTDRGFYHPTTGGLLCPVNLDWGNTKIREELRSGVLVPSGDQWPRFLYQSCEYNPEDPWNGLLQSGLLVSAYKHVFTSPSSVDSREPRATRSCNARLHGMTSTMIGSLAYIATQVRFALSSSPVFSRTDLVTDSEYFYNSVVELLEDPEEQAEVRQLLAWWDRSV